MDFQLSEDQLALQQGIRSFCEDRYRFERIAELAREPALRDDWQALAGMGVFGLRLPEREGGVGLGMAEAAVVFAELGRCLAPGPILWSHLLAALIPGAAIGETLVGGLDCAPGSAEFSVGGGGESGAPVEGGGAEWSGRGNAKAGNAAPVLVENGAELDALAVLRDDGVHRIDGPALAAGSAVGTPLDPLTPLLHLPALPQGKRIADADAAAKLRLEGAVLVAALQLGIAESTLELAVAHAKTREQFGRPIASFQAIKHFCADMFTRQELARAAVYAAAATLDDPEIGDPTRAAAAARIVAGEAAMKNARQCIQIHGGMGYTWEMPPHYHLKRALVLEQTLTPTDTHCETMAASLAAGG